MAQGSVKTFEETKLNCIRGFNIETDTFRAAFITTAFSAVLANTATPTWSDFSAAEVSGTNYTAGGEVIDIDTSEAAGTVTIAIGTDLPWTAPASGGPADIRSAIIYNVTVSNIAAWAVDMTTDGTTPLSLNGVGNDVVIKAGNLLTF